MKYPESSKNMQKAMAIIGPDNPDTRAEFQKILGISQPYLSQLLNGDRDASKPIIQKIRRVVGYDFWSEGEEDRSTKEDKIQIALLKDARQYWTEEQINAQLKNIVELGKIKNTGR